MRHIRYSGVVQKGKFVPAYAYGGTPMDEKKPAEPQEINREEFMKRLRPEYRKRQGEKCQAASRRQAR